jgi:hypothetical protein
MGLGLVAGAFVTLLAVIFGLGLRPDLATATVGFAFWMKVAYTAALAVLALTLTLHLSRPDAARPRGLWILALPIAALATLAVLELLRTPPSGWVALWLGDSWRICPWLVLGLSVPIFLGLLWAFRRLAPTRRRAAGTAAGLAAGAAAATIYGLHCPEASATFVLTWYSLGIGLAAVLGRLVGPKLLRW